MILKLALVSEEGLNKVEWKPYPDDLRYEALACGHVRRVYDNGMPAVYCPLYWSKKGYPFITIGKQGIGLHRILCRTFHGPPPSSKHIVAHRNDFPGDYTLGNLYWATPSDNAYDRVRNRKLKYDRLA